MTPVRNIVSAGLGIAAGWATVRLILRPGVSRPAQAAPGAALVVIAPVAGGGSLAGTAGALVLGAVGLVAGWTAASYRMMQQPDRTPQRVGPRRPDAPRRPAVIYFTHGEPETYEPEPWIAMLHELDSSVPGFPPKPIWPFMLGGIKQSFREVGMSPHGRIHAGTMAAVRRAVGRPDIEWRLSFLDAEPTLRDAMAETARGGATDVVLLTVFLTDSDHTQEADDLAEEMGLSEAGIRTVRTPVLWDDPRLAQMVARKVVRATGARDRATVGVMLVGHGQPEQWDLTHPTETEQEVEFRRAVRDVLLAEGYTPELVSDGWMSFREPKVPDRVRELAVRGATAVIGVPVTISADSLHSLHDTPKLVRKGARGTGVEVIDVGAWNTEDLLVEILADRTVGALAVLEEAVLAVGEDALPEVPAEVRDPGRTR